MEKRKVTIRIDGQAYSLYSDDSDDYLSALEQRADAVMKETAGLTGAVGYKNAVLSVLNLTDELMRAEEKIRMLGKGQQRVPENRSSAAPKRAAPEASKDREQVSVWDLLGEEGTGR